MKEDEMLQEGMAPLLDESPYRDKPSKHILLQVQVASYILKGAIPEDFGGLSLSEIAYGLHDIRGDMPFDDYEEALQKGWIPKMLTGEKTEYSDSTGTIDFDVRMRWKENGIIKYLINLETQNTFDPLLIIRRAFYYFARMISHQKQNSFIKTYYDDIVPVRAV